MVDKVAISGKTLLREPHKGSRGVARSTAGSEAAERRVIDLSHVLRDGIITTPGLPGPEIGDHLRREDSAGSYAPGTSFQFDRISMISGTGTYVDSPNHRFAEGADVAGLPLARLADLDGLVVRVTDGRRPVDRNALLPYDVRGRAVLIQTGWDRHWNTPDYASGEHPFVTLDGAAWLAAEGAVLVGIDTINIDDTTDPDRPAHTTLLAAGIPIVEHLTGLAQLPPDGFRFHAAPPAAEGMSSFTVRAYAVVSS
ncbi:cyclase family protein [Actinomadura barringtoniae]|uniref:Cyclase family protein n=2 Tax=Actinomadura barringtoniae TaxID=1427535 RepID=A0A939PA79_9ACTN|nr:cyclase family protein [Actinomadura barringtoniae]